jgi:hypothetical protein
MSNTGEKPTKIVSRWTKRWDRFTGDYNSELIYEWHWPDGSKSYGHSCPADEFIDFIEDGADLLNSSQALVRAAFARLAEREAGEVGPARTALDEREMEKA